MCTFILQMEIQRNFFFRFLAYKMKIRQKKKILTRHGKDLFYCSSELHISIEYFYKLTQKSQFYFHCLLIFLLMCKCIIWLVICIYVLKTVCEEIENIFIQN